MKNCQKVTELISQSHEQPLTRMERIELFFHNMMCSGCRNFQKNTQQLSAIIKEHKNSKR